jgi:hypothetical protein
MKRRTFLARAGGAMLAAPATASNVWQRHLITMAQPLSAGRIHADTEAGFVSDFGRP